MKKETLREALMQEISTNQEPDENEIKEEIDAAWKNLFLSLVDLASCRGEHADERIYKDEIQIPEDMNAKYELTISASLLDSKNRPELVILDLYREKTHSIRWIAKADWEEGQPQIKTFDISLFDIETPFVPNMLRITQQADSILNDSKSEDGIYIPQIDSVFPFPREYLNHIH